MTIEYNKIAEQTKDEHPNCEMQAVWGDLIQGEEPEDEAWASDVEFDLIAMSVRDFHFLATRYFLSCGLTVSKLAVNFFACPCCGIPGLQTTLQTMTSRLKHNGTLLILDIQKDYATTHETEESDALNQTLRKGKKISGCGNEEIATALEGLGMEDVVVLEEEDLSFRFENVLDGVSRVTTDEVYYLLKAKKGLAYHEDVDDGSQADG